MIVYNIVYISLSFLTLVYSKIKKDQRKYLTLIACIIIVLFQGLRWRTGTDWEPYLYLFEHAEEWDDSPYELGFVWLNRAISKFCGQYSYILLAESLINIGFILWFAKSFECKNPIAVLLIIIIASNVFLIRYTLAVSIVLCSYQYIVKKNFIKFIVLIILASLIHRTALLFIPAYFIANYNLSFGKICAIYSCALFLGIATSYVLSSMQYASMLIGAFLDGTSANKLESYTAGETVEYGTFSLGRYILQSGKSFLFILLYFWGKQKYYKYSMKYNVLFTLSFFGSCLNRIVIMASYEMIRLTQFFSGGTILLILMLINKANNKNRLILLIIYLIYSYSNFYEVINSRFADLYIPYYSVFEDSSRPMVY